MMFRSRISAWRLLVAAALMLSALTGQAYAKDKPIDWDKKLESGYRELSLGNVDKAVDMFADKVKHYPDSGACHTALGVALKKKGKLAEAKGEFTKATQSEPSFADGFYELGAMLEGDKDYAGAATAFDRYLQLKPSSNRSSAVAERLRYCKEQKQ